MKDKISFSIALMGIAISTAFLKDDLTILFINYQYFEVSLLHLIYLTIGLLALSIYFYSLDYIKYGFISIASFTIFKKLSLLGHIFYLLSILSPIIYLIVYIIFLILATISKIQINELQISVIIGALGLFFTLFSISLSLRIRKQERQKKREELQNLSNDSLKGLDDAYNQKRWNQYFIDIFWALEYDVSIKLTYMDIDHHHIPFDTRLKILESGGILDKKNTSKIFEMKNLRDKVLNNQYQMTKKDIDMIRDFRKEILLILKSSSSKFESLISNIIISDKGFFNKEEIISSKKFKDFDFVYKKGSITYLVEATSTLSYSIVKNKIEKIEKQLDKNVAGLLIVKAKNLVQVPSSDKIKIIVFNIKKGEFENYDDIRNWIDKNNSY
jgi:hypothetical protein